MQQELTTFNRNILYENSLSTLLVTISPKDLIETFCMKTAKQVLMRESKFDLIETFCMKTAESLAGRFLRIDI